MGLRRRGAIARTLLGQSRTRSRSRGRSTRRKSNRKPTEQRSGVMTSKFIRRARNFSKLSGRSSASCWASTISDRSFVGSGVDGARSGHSPRYGWAPGIFLLDRNLAAGNLLPDRYSDSAGSVLGDILAGRVPCGFTCPQTVWTDLFLKVRNGLRRSQQTDDARPRTLDRRKSFASFQAYCFADRLGAHGRRLGSYFTDATTAVPSSNGRASGGLYSMLASLPPRPTCWRVGRGSRFAFTCVPPQGRCRRGQPDRHLRGAGGANRAAAKRDADFSNAIASIAPCVQGLPDRSRYSRRSANACIGCGLLSTPATRSWKNMACPVI